jgi:hypothetical protein
VNYLSGLTLNPDPPDLCLLSIGVNHSCTTSISFIKQKIAYIKSFSNKENNSNEFCFKEFIITLLEEWIKW